MFTRDNIRFFVFAGISIVIISFLVYWTCLSIFFIGFDFQILTQGKSTAFRALATLFVPGANEPRFRSLPVIASFLDYRLWGLNPVGYRVVNIMMHSINSILVLLLSFFLLKDRIISLGAGLLFAIHPLHSAVLLSLSQRPDLMCTLFYLLSLASFALCVYNQRYRLFYWISIISYFRIQYNT